MRLKIRDLRVGDGVDLTTLPPDFSWRDPDAPDDDTARMVAECEMAEVIGEQDNGTPEGSPFTVETDTTWVLWTDQGGFGVDPDWEVEVSRP